MSDAVIKFNDISMNKLDTILAIKELLNSSEIGMLKLNKNNNDNDNKLILC